MKPPEFWIVDSSFPYYVTIKSKQTLLRNNFFLGPLNSAIA